LSPDSVQNLRTRHPITSRLVIY